MLIKILVILLLVIIFRTVLMGMKQINQMDQKKSKSKKKDEDIIDAEFRVIKDDE